MNEGQPGSATRWLQDNAARIPFVTIVPDIIAMMPPNIPRTNTLASGTIPAFLRRELRGRKHPQQVRLSDGRKVYVWVLHDRYSTDFGGRQYGTMYENLTKKNADIALLAALDEMLDTGFRHTDTKCRQ